MFLSSESGETFIQWRSRSGHRDGERWIHDEPADQRTGPLLRAHLLLGPSTACGREIPDGAFAASRATLAEMCHNCLRIIARPYL